MTVTFLPRTIAPDTEISYHYTAGEAIAAKLLVCKGEDNDRILVASNDDWTRMPAFGVSVQSKAEGQSIEVVQFGEVSDIQRDADFSYDDQVYVGTDGKATKTVLPALIFQSIGRAKNASDVILLINQTVVEIQ